MFQRAIAKIVLLGGNDDARWEATCLTATLATSEESRPPDSRMPSGASDMSLFTVAAINDSCRKQRSNIMQQGVPVPQGDRQRGLDSQRARYN